MKKVLLSAMISMVLAGATLAGVPSPAFHGFYAGGGLTYSKGKLELKDNDSSLNFSSSGAGVNGFLGYGTVIYGGLYLGGELGLGYDGSRFKKEVASDPLANGRKFVIPLKSTSKLTYNIVGRIGYVFSSFLAYAKVGFEGRSKINTLSTVVGSLNRNGILVGAGADYAITQNVFLRGEFTYNFGARKKISVEGETLTFRTPTKMILVGAGYRF